MRAVSSAPVADAALAEQIRLERKLAKHFSPLDVFRQARIVFSYGVERMENMIGRHLGGNAQARIHDALERSALLADASAGSSAPTAQLDFSAVDNQSWLRRAYGCNTLEAAAAAPGALESTRPSPLSAVSKALQSAKPELRPLPASGVSQMVARLAQRRESLAAPRAKAGALGLRV